MVMPWQQHELSLERTDSEERVVQHVSPPSDRPSASTIKYTSLARLMRRVRALLEPTVDKSFGLRAELSAADERGGVFYGELTESDVRGTVVAKMRCVIWSQDLRRIRIGFAREGLELSLQRGTVIGVQCALHFHPVHGLCVRVLDMDPAFVVGELELRRRRALANLERAGLIGRNAALPVPLVPNSIVLITSAQSAACQDFVRTLIERRFGVRVLLADATMQGPDTESSVLRAFAVAEQLAPDLVIVIRGGGSKTDLSWLDSEAVARRIAAFGRPVWTGIGHETDHSVLDAVAGQAFRTPTAVAEALAARLELVCTRLEEMGTRLRDSFNQTVCAERDQLKQRATRLTLMPSQRIAQRRLTLEGSRHQLQRHGQARISRARTDWTACGQTMHQVSQARLSVAQRALQSQRDGWHAAARRGVERSRVALDAATQRVEPRKLLDRLAAERHRLGQHQQALQRGSAAQLVKAQAAVTVAATAMRSRLEARVASARLALAPHAHLLRRALETRLRTAQGRVGAVHANLRHIALRALERRQDALTQVRGRLSIDRAQTRIAREYAVLEQRGLLVRAHDPRRALARGFSLTYSASGQLLRSTRELAAGDVITTQFADGNAVATIRDVQQEPDDE